MQPPTRPDPTIQTTLYSTGMRRAELVQLKAADIDKELMLVHIREGKVTRPQRAAQFQTAGRPAGILALDETDHLRLPGVRNGQRVDAPASDKIVWHACRAAAQHAGITKRVHPHTLRHYLPFRIMSCRRPVDFIFGRIARSSGDIEIGFSGPCGGERAAVGLLSSQRSRSLAKCPKAHLRRSCSPNVTGRADQYEPPGPPSVPSEQPAVGTRLCRVIAEGFA